MRSQTVLRGRWVAALVLVVFGGAGIASGQEFIRVASFNIAEFGEGSHAATRRLDEIAEMLVSADLDLVAIEEVGVGPQAEAQLAALVDSMNAIPAQDLSEILAGDGPDYFYLVTPQSGDERCAVIYRSPVVQEGECLWLDDDKDPANPGQGGKTYYRIPVAVPFRAGDFDFYVVIVHLTWADLGRREKEVLALRGFLRDTGGTEQDWIVLGDMNRYGKCAKSGKKPFDALTRISWQSKYRLPLLEAITEPDDMKVWQASQDQYSTTVAQSRDIYDQFIITAGAFSEFGTEAPEFGEHVGILAFDMQPPYSGITDHNEIKFRISDHRPIWMRLRIDLGDDD